jgi:hypothetical protein
LFSIVRELSLFGDLISQRMPFILMSGVWTPFW